MRIFITHLFSNWQSKKQFKNLPIRICQVSCFKMIQTMRKISLLGLYFHTKRAHCWPPSIFTALLSSILICRRTQLWHASLHQGITLCQICRIVYFNFCNWYNIAMCYHFPTSSPMSLLEKNFTKSKLCRWLWGYEIWCNTIAQDEEPSLFTLKVWGLFPVGKIRSSHSTVKSRFGKPEQS